MYESSKKEKNKKERDRKRNKEKFNYPTHGDETTEDTHASAPWGSPAKGLHLHAAKEYTSPSSFILGCQVLALGFGLGIWKGKL